MRGSNGAVETKELALQLASEIGYPVILKASAGGGGRGMRIAANAEELPKAFLTAQQEADTAFGVADLYLESYLERPRHVEIQILADSLGNVVHLGERDCTIQRRHQKLLEESPSPAVTEPLRRKMGRIAVEGAQAAGYVNAGTVEFLLDEDDSFYFMEMNTRIQVEHPVTEMVTGIDIVKEQMRIAAGEPLGYTQKDISFTGASIECRINAEDPDTFVPSPGKIRAFHLPGGPGVRVDTASYAECNVPPHYDSLIAKLVVHGRDRKEAIQRMKRSLDLTVIEGIKTTLPLHRRILNDDDFVAGRFNTRFLEGLAAEKLVTTP